MGMIRNLFVRTTPLQYFALTAFSGWTCTVAILCFISLYNEKLQIEGRAHSIARTIYYKNAQNTMLLGSFRMFRNKGDSLPEETVSLILPADTSAVTRHRNSIATAMLDGESVPSKEARLPIDSKIISLSASHPSFASDAWETRALAALEPGKSEYYELTDVEGRRELRYVGALRDADVCRRCHNRPDFSPGRLRGGMSIVVPLSPIWTTENEHRNFTMVLLGSLWLVGLVGITMMHRGMTSRIRERDEAREASRQIEQEKSKAESALAASTEQLHQAEHRLQTEQLRTEIAGNLHDDIGATLSSTSIFSELLGKELAAHGSPRARQLLERIKYNLLAVQFNMHDIVWAINPENDSLDSLLFKLQEYASEILDANGIDLHCSIAPVDGSLTVPMTVRKELLLIFKEALNNIIKHAQAQEVTLTIGCAEGRLNVSIRDNGRGMIKQLNGKGNGLKSMKRRALKISGMLRVESHRGGGTLLELELPLA